MKPSQFKTDIMTSLLKKVMLTARSVTNMKADPFCVAHCIVIVITRRSFIILISGYMSGLISAFAKARPFEVYISSKSTN